MCSGHGEYSGPVAWSQRTLGTKISSHRFSLLVPCSDGASAETMWRLIASQLASLRAEGIFLSASGR
jgi:hypothetical protein